MKRKHRDAMRAQLRRQPETDDDDDDAIEARDWYDEWAMTAAPEQQDESNNTQRS